MKRIVLFLAFGLLAVIFSGCTDSAPPPVLGKQVWKAEDGSVLTLYSDGTFLYQGTEIDLSGVYRWDGDMLTITHTWGTSVLEHKGDTLVLTRDGQVWQKQ